MNLEGGVEAEPTGVPPPAPKLPPVEQDALMSPNPRGKLKDLVVGCVCCLVV